jgi:hypothetical protein
MDVLIQIIRYLLQGKRHEARSLAIRKWQRLLRRYFAWKGHEGVKVVNEEWDYLIILDACRYDYFAGVYAGFLEGRLEKRTSQASATSEFLKKNFLAYYGDIVYLSGNPHCSDYRIHEFRGVDHFYAVDHVWKYAWDEELDTLPAPEMTKAALKAKEKYPDKKLIIHYIQPHGPWIGETKITANLIERDPNHKSAVEGKWTIDSRVWELVYLGKFDMELLKKADMDNLLYVLPEVRKLVDQLDGRIIVTADHGEAFGEKSVYGHPPGTYIKELVEIPWLVIDKGPSRVKKVVTSRAAEAEQPVQEGDDVLAKRLRALGYIE